MSRRPQPSAPVTPPPASRHGRPRGGAASVRRFSVPGALEVMEGRVLPSGATITVNNPNDDGSSSVLSLRQAIDLANGTLPLASLAVAQANQVSGLSIGANPVIVFDPGLAGTTITLVGSELPAVTADLTIDGSGAPSLAVSGGGLSRVPEVAAGARAGVSSLTLEDGTGRPSSDAPAGSGGVILNAGTLTLTATTVTASAH